MLESIQCAYFSGKERTERVAVNQSRDDRRGRLRRTQGIKSWPTRRALRRLHDLWI